MPSVVISSSAADPVSGTFDVTITFSEAVTGFDVTEILVGNGSASGFAGSGAAYTATITPQADYEGDVVISVSANSVQDAAGNGNAPSNELRVGTDTLSPVLTITRDGSGVLTGAFVANFTFSEPVDGFAVSSISSTSAISVSDFTGPVSAGAGEVYKATITPEASGAVHISVGADQFSDKAGNRPAAPSELTLSADLDPPTFTFSPIEVIQTQNDFTVNFTASENVSGLELSELVAENATLSELNINDTAYSVKVTTAGTGEVSLSIPAGVAEDAAGNTNVASDALIIKVDVDAPTLEITTASNLVTGPFVASFTFSEDVTGFEESDIAFTNARLSNFAGTGASYSATITPVERGEVSLNVAAGAAKDAALLDSEAASLTVEAGTKEIEVTVEVDDKVEDVTEITAQAEVSNPGISAVQFETATNMNWLSVTPAFGTIEPQSQANINIQVNENAEGLAPGTYTGVVTVTQRKTGPVSLSAQSVSQGVKAQASGDDTLVEIPITFTIAARRGTITLVTTTPGGEHGDVVASFTSSDSDIDGLELVTEGGQARSEAYDRRFGSYTVTQSLPTGWRLDSLSCVGDLDAGSRIVENAGQVVIDLDPQEAIVCTFAAVRDEAWVRQMTMTAIRSFMAQRADRILAASPDLSVRLRQSEGATPVGFAADVRGGNAKINGSVSLSALRAAGREGDPFAGDNTSPWDVWMSGDYQRVTLEREGRDESSDFSLIQIGSDYRMREDLLIGAMVQIDTMRTENLAQEDRPASLVSGTGFMVGPYVAARFGEGIYVDGRAMWGRSDNDVNPIGLYTDSFETTRWLIEGHLRGDLTWGRLMVTPTLGWQYFQETQEGYTDSLNIAIPSQTLTIGRVSFGPKLAYRLIDTGWGTLDPYADLTAVWDYNDAQLLNTRGSLVDFGRTRADARLGFTSRFVNGTELNLDFTLSGLGQSNFQATGGQLTLRKGF